ncbi:type IV toxin-antitoxin system AbiEi family antitoxin domain-containing protein [Nocardiopsis synnemataformans]|uniref:type IV toxin-antitoxin system AbiEi family antitoxin domain-containing protein n=1 Tax=Nocardiopsis synnemataformans TaxID=61305 RepID=UPI003EBD9DFA
MPRSNTMASLADLAEEQWGLFTRRQAEATGMAWSTLARHASDGATVERVAHGVYRLRGAPPPDHLDLRAAWLQLAPSTPAWERTPAEGVVSHRSAASLYGLGHLPADIHEFTLPERRQSRRPDLRLRRGLLSDTDWTTVDGLPVSRPRRIVSDLLSAREDPGAVGHITAEALRASHDDPTALARALSAHAGRFGLRRGDGPALLRWLLDLAAAPERDHWLSRISDTETDTSLS